MYAYIYQDYSDLRYTLRIDKDKVITYKLLKNAVGDAEQMGWNVLSPSDWPDGLDKEKVLVAFKM